ncbi:hypothetical protein GDO81_028510 [Engystomops pustulosus]|uniref:Uncharacterized protein n=1 Tax=Engystomops pustulosus TaxID=76066 RepID=A0AAV6YKG3_ENGPU|nr:hypothetical protein GDO81_028510 [Engystomops pustulosus]
MRPCLEILKEFSGYKSLTRHFGSLVKDLPEQKRIKIWGCAFWVRYRKEKLKVLWGEFWSMLTSHLLTYHTQWFYL